MIKSVKEYLKQKTENLSFIELMKDSYVDINGYRLTSDIPLPIIINELITEIKEGRAQEELKIKSFIEGIIYTLGVDSDFKYFDVYKKILYSYDKKIEDYILYKGLKFTEDKLLDDAIVYFSALVNINRENINGLYNYGFALEELAKRFFKNKDIKSGEIFINESARCFEDIIDIDPSFSISYYKLGFYYKNKKQFRKCKIIWEKFIETDDNEERINEIKQELIAIKDDIAYEEGYTEILCGKPYSGLEKLLPLQEKYSDWWNLLFMVGLAYRQTEQYIKAKEQFEMVLAMYPNQVDSLNELGLCLTLLDKLDEAIEKFTLAINLKPNDFEILCNRGMTYLQLGDLVKATLDIEKAYEINSEDEVTIACMKQLMQVKKSRN